MEDQTWFNFCHCTPHTAWARTPTKARSFCDQSTTSAAPWRDYDYLLELTAKALENRQESQKENSFSNPSVSGRMAVSFREFFFKYPNITCATITVYSFKSGCYILPRIPVTGGDMFILEILSLTIYWHHLPLPLLGGKNICIFRDFKSQTSKIDELFSQDISFHEIL